MPIEIIGEFGTPGASSEWTEASPEDPFDPKKPPEPPDTLNFFEWQRSISKLIKWLLDYIAYRHHRP